MALIQIHANNVVAAIKKTAEGADKSIKKLTDSQVASLTSSFEDGFFNIMTGNFGKLEGDFVRTIDRMVAKALAADLAKKLFAKDSGVSSFLGGFLNSGGGGGGGAKDAAGGGGGFFSSMFSGISGLFSGGKAIGGDVIGGRQHLVGENGPELFTPKVNGTITKNSSLNKSTNINMTVNTNDAVSFKQSQNQLMADIAAQLNLSNQRDL
jgi:hypothetical protein